MNDQKLSTPSAQPATLRTQEVKNMREYTRITVPLSRDEFVALRDTAGSEYRHPRDHARYLLRQALGLTSEDDQPQQMHNRTGVRQDIASAVASN